MYVLKKDRKWAPTSLLRLKKKKKLLPATSETPWWFHFDHSSSLPTHPSPEKPPSEFCDNYSFVFHFGLTIFLKHITLKKNLMWMASHCMYSCFFCPILYLRFIHVQVRNEAASFSLLWSTAVCETGLSLSNLGWSAVGWFPGFVIFPVMNSTAVSIPVHNS